MNVSKTAAALTVLAATTAAFAGQEQPSSPTRSTPNALSSSYQYEGSAVSGGDIQASASWDSASCQRRGEPMKGSPTSTAFAAKAAQDGMVEVALAGLALQKSRNDEVRQFAQRMAQDYAQSNDQLDSIVKCEELVLPTELDAKHYATIQRLNAASGSAFDRGYLKHIEETHSKALFESASKSDDPDVVAFAENGLSMVQEHQQLADNLRVAIGPRVASSR
jgi:predicted outer membrane protein